MSGRATFTIVMSTSSMKMAAQTAISVHHLRSSIPPALPFGLSGNARLRDHGQAAARTQRDPRVQPDLRPWRRPQPPAGGDRREREPRLEPGEPLADADPRPRPER